MGRDTLTREIRNEQLKKTGYSFKWSHSNFIVNDTTRIAPTKDRWCWIGTEQHWYDFGDNTLEEVLELCNKNSDGNSVEEYRVMTKTLDTLVEDVYKLMKTKNTSKDVDTEEEIEKFGEAMKTLMRQEFLPNQRNFSSRGGLRLSSIGKPDLQQWYASKKFSGEKIQPATLIKFMYGHMIEEMVLFFVRLSGHQVTDEQKECVVGGVKGHMDCKIDGVVVDVKSTTPFGFKKFKDGTLAADDNFGYVDQIKAYAHAEGERKWAWLAMDKQSGALCVLKYDLDDTKHPMYDQYSSDIEDRIEHVKKSVEGEDRPSLCAEPVPDGKSGNLKLPTICSYCQYKRHCHPDLRTFIYSTGPRYLTTVNKKPDVLELDNNF